MWTVVPAPLVWAGPRGCQWAFRLGLSRGSSASSRLRTAVLRASSLSGECRRIEVRTSPMSGSDGFSREASAAARRAAAPPALVRERDGELQLREPVVVVARRSPARHWTASGRHLRVARQSSSSSGRVCPRAGSTRPPGRAASRRARDRPARSPRPARSGGRRAMERRRMRRSRLSPTITARRRERGPADAWGREMAIPSKMNAVPPSAGNSQSQSTEPWISQ